MGPLTIPIVIDVLKVVSDSETRRTTAEFITLARTLVSTVDNKTKSKAMEKLDNKVEALAKAANNSEQAKNVLISIIDGAGSILGALVPPVVKDILYVSLNIIATPFKWLSRGQDINFSKAIIEWHKKD
jgi:hypothetical protein